LTKFSFKKREPNQVPTVPTTENAKTINPIKRLSIQSSVLPARVFDPTTDKVRVQKENVGGHLPASVVAEIISLPTGHPYVTECQLKTQLMGAALATPKCVFRPLARFDPLHIKASKAQPLPIGEIDGVTAMLQQKQSTK